MIETGIDQGTLYRFARGMATLTLDTANLLADVLDLKLAPMHNGGLSSR